MELAVLTRQAELEERHRKHHALKCDITDEVFQERFKQDAHYVRERFHTEYAGRQEDIIAANIEAGRRFQEKYGGNEK